MRWTTTKGPKTWKNEKLTCMRTKINNIIELNSNSSNYKHQKQPILNHNDSNKL